MENPDPLLTLSPKAVKMAKVLMWAAIAATFLHFVAIFLIDPVDFMAREHAAPSGVGIIVDDFPPLFESSLMVSALAIADFLLKALIYLGIAVFARSLSQGLAFDHRVIRGARFFGWTVIAVAIQDIAFNTLASLVRTPGESAQPLYIMISSPQMVSLFLGVTLVVFVSIFAKANLVAADSASIV